MGFDAIISEIKAGGIKGCIGLDQLDWGGKAGACYEFWKLEPCCGSPCNVKDALWCMFCWYCCGFCSSTKMFASSLNQECALVPHILFMWFCSPFAGLCMRYNLRKRYGAQGNMCGDLVCLWCFGCCACLQELRSVQPSAWDCTPLKCPGLVAPQVKLCL